MCVAIYIASDHPLPTVPWDDAQPAFHVQDATEGYFSPGNPLRAHFAQPYLYAAGSHDGCGCGFPFSDAYNDEGELVEDDWPPGRESRRRLAEFLSAALRLQPAVEILVCCSGDERFPPRTRRRVRPIDFTRDRTIFDLGQLLVVSEQDAEPSHGLGSPGRNCPPEGSP